MAYETGTSSGVLVGVNQAGGLGLAGGKSSSGLAKKVKPPAKESVGESIAIIILLVVAFNFLGGVLMLFFNPFIGLGVAVGLTIVVAVFFAIKGRKNKDNQQRRFDFAMLRWRQSWICLRCGHSFLIRTPKTAS